MTYELYLGDYTYSSWSLRAFLVLYRYRIPHTRHMIWFGDDASVAEKLAARGVVAKTVPTLRTDDGIVLGDSLAIAEELASRHPDLGLWPEDPSARAIARGLTAEMHSGFSALRAACPMDLRRAYRGFEPNSDVLADVARIDQIWSAARAQTGPENPWLCGDYSIADAFYAPVAARIATYGLPVSEAAQHYVMAHLHDPAFRAWRAMGLVRGEDLAWYAQDLETHTWPGPTVATGQAGEHGPSVNDACPYSGKPVTHFMIYEDRVWGFCNAFCRDKTAADPEAWYAFTEMRDRFR